MKFVLGPMIFNSVARRDLLLKYLAVLGLYLSVVGVAALAGVDSLVWPRYVLDTSIGISTDRARGPLLSSEAYGMITGLGLIASCALVARTRDWWREFAVVAAVACVIASALSLTRSVWLGAGLAVIVSILATRSLRRWFPLIVGTAALAGVTALTASPALAERFSSRAETQRSVYDRVLTNDAALRIIEAKPIAGIGWQNFLSQSGRWVRQSDSFPLTTTTIEIHNVFLSRAAETGLIGAAFWLLAVALGPVLALARSKATDLEGWGWKLIGASALFIWLVPSLTSPNPYPLPNFLVWLVAGIGGRAYLMRPSQPPATQS